MATFATMRKGLLAVLLLLIFAAPAEAGWKRDRALAIGNIVWGNPCPQVDFAYEAHDDWDGWWAYSDGCKVRLNAKPDLPWLWPIYCTIVIHELGHAAGHPHSENPNSIMYPTHSFAVVNGKVEAGADRRCNDAGRPYLRKHNVLVARHPRPRP